MKRLYLQVYLAFLGVVVLFAALGLSDLPWDGVLIASACQCPFMTCPRL